MRLLVDESKLNISRAAVVEQENVVLPLLQWKIPNFSMRHFLEGLLCVGFAGRDDLV